MYLERIVSERYRAFCYKLQKVVSKQIQHNFEGQRVRTEGEKEAGDKGGGKKTERWIEGEMEEVLGRNLVIELNEFGHGTPSQVYLSNKQKTAETVKLGTHFSDSTIGHYVN